ncbi:hypothetical protein K491DRAFT_679910 [Lophiostoma macrostomum CBS 122681]|uniref:Uncharacterized protein n=1 Tax=Lophiostoma macrostomum CBS 122681 TaxID=1314788 RepID=A0A6A6T2G9_9PLEO|nr:hypothetical protein K491DRAFT_679910 [Lophiostoma macrostomum CBS 122681]
MPLSDLLNVCIDLCVIISILIKYYQRETKIHTIDNYETDIQTIKTLADKIVLQIASTSQWSTYHNWKTVSSLASTNTADRIAEYKRLWQHPRRYGTCVDFANLCAQRLRTALSTIPSLSHHASNVKLEASRPSEKLTGQLGRPEHVIATLQIGTSLIVMDPNFAPSSIVLRTGEKREICSFVTFDDDLTSVSYYWFCRRKAPHRGTLVYISSSASRGAQAYSTSEMSWDDAIMQLTFDMAKEMRKYDGKKFPESKFLLTGQVLSERPLLPAVETPGGFWTYTCKVAFYFHTGWISVLFPLADWLYKPENGGSLRRMEELGVSWTKLVRNASTGRLQVRNSGSREDKERIELVAEMVERLGIDRTEFLKAVEDVS